MVSKTSLAESVRGHRVDEVRDGLAARPDLIGYRDARGRSWLHLACSVPGTPIAMAELLLGLGLGLDDAAFTEGAWRATPLWFAVARGQNHVLAGHLLKRGCNPNFCLFAAAWNEDRAMIRLLLAHGADIEEGAGGRRCSARSAGASSARRKNCCWVAPIPMRAMRRAGRRCT